MKARDGDTIECLLDLGFGVFVLLAVRLTGLEAAEPSGSTAENAKADAARIMHRWREAECVVIPATRGLDCYGRLRGQIITNDGNLADWLISQKIAWVSEPKRTTLPATGRT